MTPGSGVQPHLFVILGGGEQSSCFSIAQCMQRNFLAFEEFLDDHPCACPAKGLIDHNLVNGLVGFLQVLGQDHSFAKG